MIPNMPVIIVLAGVFLVGVYYVLFNKLYSQSSKKVYLELLLKLEENPDDKELKDKTMEAEIAYKQKSILNWVWGRGVR